MDPVINVEESVGKTVGSRRPARPMDDPRFSIAESRKWREMFGGVRVPRGVFRFHSHEEADAWLWKMITRPRAD